MSDPSPPTLRGARDERLACCFCGSHAVEVWADGQTVRCGGCSAVYGIDKLVPAEPAALQLRKLRRDLPAEMRCEQDDGPADYRRPAQGASLRIEFASSRFLGLQPRLSRLVALALGLGSAFALGGSTLGPVLAVALALAAAAYAALSWAGRCRVTVERGALEVRVGPLRRRLASVPVSELRQLYCEEQRPSASPKNQRYRLLAWRKDGKKVPVLADLRSLEVALALEDRIEDFLEIADEPVPGEAPRTYVSVPSQRLAAARGVEAPRLEGDAGAEAQAEAEAEAEAEPNAEAAEGARRAR